MSEPLRVALVAEGPTERVVLEAALAGLLSHRSYILKQLQPEESLPFGAIGTGWVGVYRWCKQALARSGASLRHDILYQAHDLLLLQLDADVADETYANGGIQETVQDLPCSGPCPPPSASTDALRRVLLRWVGEPQPPPRTVLCTPSKSTDAWVVAALFPDDLAVQKGIECWPNPASRLPQQPVAQRINKRVEDYQARGDELCKAWPRLSRTLDEARRFDTELRAALGKQP
ncbi:conserved hypothetical protein [Verrucomicrobia bacterium]|nr:conserved hypothetical protein [Verrucomicrobiota bacterium]